MEPEKSNLWIFFNFLPIFCGRWTCTTVETNQGIAIPYLRHKQQHFWSLGTDCSPENGHIQPWKRAKKLWSSWEVLKSDTKAEFWCSLGAGRGFGICQPVSKCLLMFLSHLKGSKMKSSKKHHFSALFPYWKAPYLKMKSAGIRHLLFGSFNAFSLPIG